MNRASDDTQFDLKNAGPSDPISTNSPPPSRKIAPQSTKRTRPAVPAKDVTGELKRKRERSSKDEGRNDNKTRFQKPHIPRFPKEGTFAKADNGNRLQANGSVATKASHGKDGLEGSHDVSNSTRPQGHLLPLTAKDESPWKTYNKEYTIELGGLVNVAERKYPAHGQVGVKEFSGQDAESKLSRLRQIPEDFRNRYFVTCIEVFNFHNALHLITEYMTISLLHIVKAPRYPREKQVAAIIGQILGGIEYLESQRLVHGDITCSSVLLSQDGTAKIANLECCRAASADDRRDHPDSQALGDIMMQLVEKRRRRNGTVGADELDRWSRPVTDFLTDFLSDTTSASAKELAQHEFLQNEWRKEDLLSLISFAQIASRWHYKD